MGRSDTTSSAGGCSSPRIFSGVLFLFGTFLTVDCSVPSPGLSRHFPFACWTKQKITYMHIHTHTTSYIHIQAYTYIYMHDTIIYVHMYIYDCMCVYLYFACMCMYCMYLYVRLAAAGRLRSAVALELSPGLMWAAGRLGPWDIGGGLRSPR